MTKLNKKEQAWLDCRAAMLAQPQIEPQNIPNNIPDGLVAAVNRLLDSDGSRGRFSAVKSFDAREEIERLLAQPVSSGYTLNSPEIPDSWVACSERMPTPFVDVIASDGKQTFTAHFIDEADWWCLVSQLAEEPGDVTHWMPLPAAPEGGSC